MVEASIIYPVTFLILLSLVVGAMGIFRYQEVSHLAREAARYASTHGAQYRKDNGLGSDASVPVDAVTASGSGLDPHISVANARIQARRVAGARDLSLDQVLRLVANHTQSRPLGVLGENVVNVLTLNLALDELR